MVEKVIYVGAENEFQLMRGKEYESFSEHWGSFASRYSAPTFSKGETSIRTKVGNGIYADGREPEVCTAPIRVEPGFVDKFADSLYLARKELIDFIGDNQKYDLIGFSSHWNITDPNGISSVGLISSLGVPYSLLTLTPLSCGMNLRNKPDRLELLGDYIENEDQVRAFILFYTASVLQFENNAQNLPFSHYSRVNGAPRISNLVEDGRYTQIEVDFGSSQKVISAQTYLEVYYNFFKDGIEEIGTPEDVKNLEDFVFGRKKLEVDRLKKYASISYLKNRPGGALVLDNHPSVTVNPNDYREERDLPDNHARFLSELVKGEKGFHAERMGWEEIHLIFDNDYQYLLKGINFISYAGEILAQTSDPELFEDAISFLNQTSNNYRLVTSESVRDANDISDKLARILTTAVKRVHPQESRLVNLAPLENIKERITEIEAKFQPYDQEQDNSLTEPYQDLMNGRIVNEFSLRSVWKKSDPHGAQKDGSLYTIGAIVGILAAFLFPATKYRIDFDPVEKTEHHAPATYSSAEEMKKNESNPCQTKIPWSDDLCLEDLFNIKEDKNGQ